MNIDFGSMISDKNLDSKTKLIFYLESQFYFLETEQKNILYSNNEMMKVGDDFCLESIEINKDIYKKNLIKMKEIQQKIKFLTQGNHCICKKEIDKIT